MGLLDDAIREHLELKRRRGADPAEVAQQEREALGPVRGAGDPAAAEELEPALAEPPVAEADPAEVDFEPRGSVRAPEPEPEEPAPQPEPEPEPEPALPPAAEHVSQPTRQYSVDELDELRRDAEPEPADDVVPADEDPPPEDVLDETPDFLQEAPEHDRLWFEQRPPRDFDF
jgi:hypothetical protein